MVWCEWLGAGAEVVMLSSSMGAGAGKSARLARSSATALTTDIGKPRLLLDDLSDCTLPWAAGWVTGCVVGCCWDWCVASDGCWIPFGGGRSRSGGISATSASKSILCGGDIKCNSSRLSVKVCGGVPLPMGSPTLVRRGVLRGARRVWSVRAGGLSGKEGQSAAAAVNSNWAGSACCGAAKAKARRALDNLQRSGFVWSCALRTSKQDQARAGVPQLWERRLAASTGTGLFQVLLLL